MNNPWRNKSIFDRIALLTCLIFFIAWSYALSFKYFHFGYYDWDFALYSQTMWGLTHGTIYTSLFETTFLSNHAQYIAFLLTPIYFFAQHPLTLLVLKVFALSLSGFLLYRIGRKWIGEAGAFILMLLFLFYPANIFMLLFEFDFENLAPALILLMFYFFVRNRLVPFLLTTLLAALIKENISLIPIMFGLYALFTKRQNKILWSVIPILIGGGIFYISMYHVMPHFRLQEGIGSANQYLGLYSKLGTSVCDIVKNSIADPGKFISIIWTPENFSYLQDLIGPLNILPLLSPHMLFLGAPIFLQTLLASPGGMHTIYYHYAATLVPFIFLATLCTFRWAKQSMRPLAYQILLGIAVIGVLAHNFGHEGNYTYRIKAWADYLDPVREEMLIQVPFQDGVIATFDFLAPLSQRKLVYAFYNIVRGFNVFSGENPYTPPEDIQHALIDWQDPWLWGEVFSTRNAAKQHEIFERLHDYYFTHAWSVSMAADNLTLLTKQKNQGPPLMEYIQPSFHNPAKLTVDKKFTLLDIQVGAHDKLIPIVFKWKSHQNLDDIYQVTISLEKEGNWVVKRNHVIGYAINPTILWEEGDQILERFWFFPGEIAPGVYRLGITFLNVSKAKPAQLEYSGDSGSTGHTFMIGTLEIR